jgi:PKD domain
VLATWEWQGGVQATELPVGAAAWREPFPTPPGLPQSYRVGFDGSGGLVAVWGNQNGDTACTLAASHRPAGAADWTPPIALAGLSGSAWGTRYAIGTAGDVYAAYEAPNGTALEVAALDTAAPLITVFRAPRTGHAGRRLAFSAAAFDLSGAALRWSFGDGSRSAPGASVTHGFRKSGRYRVTVTATDPAGHATTARATVATAPRRPRR